MNELQKIDATLFLQAFKYGANEVLKSKDYLNQINVYPVADSDTGNNLASLMRAIMDLPSKSSKDFNNIASQLGDTMLSASRGNSGAIFTQFWLTFVNHFDENEYVSIHTFVNSAHHALKQAYSAVENPMNGTMLTVMKVWVTSLDSFQNETNHFTDLLNHSLIKAKQAVHKTTEELAVLKKNNVVDAGALGFYIFIEGFSNAIQDDSLRIEESEIPVFEEVVSNHYISEKPTNRYCTEILIDNLTIDTSGLKNVLSPLGDSQVIAATNKKARIHIHTNHPVKVASCLQEYGDLVEQKVDDMLIQYQVGQEMAHTTAIVTDSIADLPQSFIENHHIFVVPLLLNIDNNQYLDRITLDSSTLFEKQNKANITSSQPSYRQVENLLHYLSKLYDEVLVISVSSQLSGSYQLFKNVVQGLNLEDKVYVLDSKKNSAAQGLVVKRAVELRENHLKAKEIIENLNNELDHIDILVALKNIDVISRSGRVPKIIKNVLTKINIYPIISLDKNGKGTIKALSFNFERSQRKLVKMVSKKRVVDFAVVHANNIEDSQKLAQILTNRLEKNEAYIENISSVIALNTGQGAVAVGYSFKED